MAVPKLNDQRSEIRDDRFSGEFSCKLVCLSADSREIPIRPMDVSRRGLGFVAREPLRVGQCFKLSIEKHVFRVELAYCGSYLGIEGLFRCGLFLREADGDLHALCVKLGLLDDKHVRGNLKALYLK